VLCWRPYNEYRFLIFWRDERNIYLSYWMYVGSVMLGRQKYIQLSRLYLMIVLLRLKILLHSWDGINLQVVIKFLQKRLKQEVKYYGLKSINSVILFGIRTDCLSSGTSLLLCQFTRRVIELTVIIIEGYHYYQLHIRFYQDPSLKAKYICKHNYALASVMFPWLRKVKRSGQRCLKKQFS
jgi:hypothetical protein